MYGYDDILVLPEDLLRFAWSQPMRDLAKMVGISDVGLKKLLASKGIPAPPQGYWNRVHAGKPVPGRPKVPARRPGETGRIRLDQRFAEVVQTTCIMPSSGPFASAAVPEDLEQLREQELKAIGRVAVGKSLDRLHPALLPILKKEDRRREKMARERWCWDKPKFDGPLDQRRLRILSAVFLALARRGHAADAYERDEEIHAVAIIGDTRVGVEVEIAIPHKTVLLHGRQRPSPDLPAKTPLEFRVRLGFDRSITAKWSDDKEGTLEKKIAVIAAGLIVEGEARFRRGLREAEEVAEQKRLREEARRQEEIAARNAERLQNLHRSAELLRRAEDLRALIERVRIAIADGLTNLDVQTIHEWEAWARAEADKIDPISSRQVLTHLLPPTG